MSESGDPAPGAGAARSGSGGGRGARARPSVRVITLRSTRRPPAGGDARLALVRRVVRKGAAAGTRAGCGAPVGPSLPGSSEEGAWSSGVPEGGEDSGLAVPALPRAVLSCSLLLFHLQDMDGARLWLGLLLPVVAALDFRYHHQEGMEAFLKSVAQNYSSITHLHSIGKSVRGRWPPAHVPNPQLTFKS